MNNNNNNTMLTTSTSITLSSSSSLNDNNENNNENENNENSLIQLENIMKELQKNILCGICLDDIKDSRSLNCSHTFCNNCILELIKSNPKCPYCSKEINSKEIINPSKVLNPIIESVRVLLNNYYGINQLVNDEEQQKQKQLIVAPVRIERQLYAPGDIVHIAPRMWPGINKPGGAAWITFVHENGESYDVKYIVGGGSDLHVPFTFVRNANDIQGDRSQRIRRSKIKPIDNHNNNIDNNNIVSPTLTSDSSQSSSRKRKRKGIENNNENNNNNNNNNQQDNLIQQSSVTTTTINTTNTTSLTSSSSSSEKKGTKTKKVDKKIQPNYVFLATTLSEDQHAILRTFCIEFPSCKIVTTYNENVTHLIVSPVIEKIKNINNGTTRNARVLHQRTMKYLQGLLGGKWIVSIEWIERCLSEHQIIQEDPYEIDKDYKAAKQSFGIPHISRVNARSGRQKLFQNNRIIFYGNFPSPGPTRGDLEDLLGRGGASLLTIPNVVDTINTSLDGGLKVDRAKHTFEKSQIIICIVSTKNSLNEFYDMLYASIIQIRQPLIYDYEDFIDHIDGVIITLHADWVFDCISNYIVSDPSKSTYRINYLTDVVNLLENN